MIKHETAQKIASAWHGGQWSQLYSFASSGILSPEYSLWIIEEVTQEILKPETALKPFERSKKDSDQLVKLRDYLLQYFNKEFATDIRIGKDFYGFDLPVLHGTNFNVRAIRRLQ